MKQTIGKVLAISLMIGSYGYAEEEKISTVEIQEEPVTASEEESTITEESSKEDVTPSEETSATSEEAAEGETASTEDTNKEAEESTLEEQETAELPAEETIDLEAENSEEAIQESSVAEESSVNETISYEVITPGDMSNQETINDFFGGKMQNYALELTKGVIFPFELVIKSSFFSLKNPGGLSELTVEQTLYIRCLGDNRVVFSSDLENWQHFEDFFTGSIGTSLNVSNTDTHTGITIELEKR